MRVHRIVWRCLAALLLISPVAAPAIQILASPAPAAKTSAAPSPAPTIAAEQARDSDGRIAQRIRGIFAELPSLARVTAKVQQGVVTLGGTVEDDADKARAESIASRVAGVATVENGIAVDRSANSGVAGIRKVSQKFEHIADDLPLAGTALLVALLVGGIGYFIAGR